MQKVKESEQTNDKGMEKEPFEQVPSSHAGDKVLRRRRKSRGIIPAILRNIQRLFYGYRR